MRFLPPKPPPKPPTAAAAAAAAESEATLAPPSAHTEGNTAPTLESEGNPTSPAPVSTGAVASRPSLRDIYNPGSSRASLVSSSSNRSVGKLSKTASWIHRNQDTAPNQEDTSVSSMEEEKGREPPVAKTTTGDTKSSTEASPPAQTENILEAETAEKRNTSKNLPWMKKAEDTGETKEPPPWLKKLKKANSSRIVETKKDDTVAELTTGEETKQSEATEMESDAALGTGETDETTLVISSEEGKSPIEELPKRRSVKDLGGWLTKTIDEKQSQKARAPSKVKGVPEVTTTADDSPSETKATEAHVRFADKESGSLAETTAASTFPIVEASLEGSSRAGSVQDASSVSNTIMTDESEYEEVVEEDESEIVEEVTEHDEEEVLKSTDHDEEEVIEVIEDGNEEEIIEVTEHGDEEEIIEITEHGDEEEIIEVTEHGDEEEEEIIEVDDEEVVEENHDDGVIEEEVVDDDEEIAVKEGEEPTETEVPQSNFTESIDSEKEKTEGLAIAVGRSPSSASIPVTAPEPSPTPAPAPVPASAAAASLGARTSDTVAKEKTGSRSSMISKENYKDPNDVESLKGWVTGFEDGKASKVTTKQPDRPYPFEVYNGEDSSPSGVDCVEETPTNQKTTTETSANDAPGLDLVATEGTTDQAAASTSGDDGAVMQANAVSSQQDEVSETSNRRQQRQN